MNSSPHHSKVKVSLTLAHSIFVAGKFVSGKMEMECRADKGLGIDIMMVELIAFQELTSRDHSATSTFLHSRRLFQGPGLPPSNAVQAHPMPGDPPLPPNYHQARRGISTFLFRIPLPSSVPSSISFGSDVARVRYEVRATVGVVWKGEKRLVTCKREIEVVESYGVDFSRAEPEGVVVGEFGKIWAQGRVVGGIIVAGEMLPGIKPGEPSPLQLSDVLTTVPFRGPDYIIHPGGEGIASLVFDVPKHARGVRGGTLEGDESEGHTTESLFEVRCIVGITINMGIGTKDIHLDLPVPIVHPSALPEPAEQPVHSPYHQAPAPYLPQHHYAYPALPASPPMPAVYFDPVQNQVWLPSPQTYAPQPHYFMPIEGIDQPYYFPPQVHIPAYVPTRPLSAGPAADNATHIGLGPAPPQTSQHLGDDMQPEEGKGQRASRFTQHLRLSSRHRSVSPRSHRFPLTAPPAVPAPPGPATVTRTRTLPPAPISIPSPPQNDTLSAQVVHSPRPYLSPKHSFTNSLPKSERVEQLERMAEEVEKTTVDLSADLPKVIEPRTDDAAPLETDVNKTLPAPPPLMKKVKDPLKASRPRINDYFSQEPASLAPPAPASEHRAPPTPLAAVTPVRLPKHKSVEFRAQLQSESGLDALEKRLLAEVGTRKMDLAEQRRPVWSIVGVQPIDIPVKDVTPDPLNDSAISSLTLAGEWEGAGLGVGAGAGLGEVDVELDAGIELDMEHDSDEKTHRAGRSSGSGDSRRNSGRKKSKRKEKDANHKEGEGPGGRKKKAAAAKGRVAAWLGGIDPEVPPMEEVVPLSPAVSKRPPLSIEDDHLPQVDEPSYVPPPSADVKPVDEVSAPNPRSSGFVPAEDDHLSQVDEPSYVPPPSVDIKPVDEMSAAPNPRSSGFVPVGTFKHGTSPRLIKPLARDATVAVEARRVADLWSSSSPPAVVLPPADNDGSMPVVLDISPVLPLLSPTPRGVQSIITDRQYSPPSSSGVLDALAAKHRDINAATKAPLEKNITRLPPPKKIIAQPSAQLPSQLAPQPDPEAKYDIRSARGGRGGRVTAITSIWASGALEAKSNLLRNVPISTPKPRRPPQPAAEPKVHTPSSGDPLPAITKPPPRTPVKSLLTASSPLAVTQTSDPKSVNANARGKRPRPIIKSSSVPAVISSSHATPMLSSTASLARPSPNKSRAAPAKVPPTIGEARTDSTGHFKSGTSAKAGSSAKPAGGELAFGQARLRDLIKKYQGQAT
ncbi:hypothetical protein DXG03_001583 [Asterophora parasitica]|uniref:Arrestin-like N-terminal domain-containing protein n=1 Tax=Asterophora parasitica TaxID=117018 RepID=A0A9P7G9E6_9AGAR|nr:hypothetical protein DXG03_001583 [Asterophora parasitica]